MDDTCLVPCVIGSCPLGREGPLGCHTVHIACHGEAASPGAGAVYPTILEVSFILSSLCQEKRRKKRFAAIWTGSLPGVQCCCSGRWQAQLRLHIVIPLRTQEQGFPDVGEASCCVKYVQGNPRCFLYLSAKEYCCSIAQDWPTCKVSSSSLSSSLVLVSSLFPSAKKDRG